MPGRHGDEVHEADEAHPFPDAAVEDVECFIGVARQGAERLVLGAEEVQEGEVNDEEEADAVGKDEEELRVQRETEELEEDVEDQPGEDE